jgi:endonuclease III
MKSQKAAPASEKVTLLLEVHYQLSEVYGRNIHYFHDLDPLSELVSALLSHRTRNSASGQAFKNLKTHFGTWEAVRDAPTALVKEALMPCTWPEQKAPRIQQVLQCITEQEGTLSLDFLKDMDTTAARQWLEALPGVGPKTSAAVISFSNLRGKALPVDSHHFRVAHRLGIIEEKLGEAKANRVLEDMLPETFTAQEVYDHHQVMMKHGQKVCFYQRPNCEHCVVLRLCPTGQARLGAKRQ